VFQEPTLVASVFGRYSNRPGHIPRRRLAVVSEICGSKSSPEEGEDQPGELRR